MRTKSSIFPHHFGLGDRDDPVRRPPRYDYGRAYSGMSSASKAYGRPSFNSLLERDLQTLLEADSQIGCFAVEPHRLTYFLAGPAGRLEKRTYTPDVVVHRIDGTIVVLDAKASFYRSLSDWPEKEIAIREAYQRDHGVGFLVLSERELRAQPRLSNCEIIVSRARGPVDPEIEFLVLDELSGGARQIGAIYRALPAPQQSIFAAAMSLVKKGKVRFDLGRPVSVAITLQRVAGP